MTNNSMQIIGVAKAQAKKSSAPKRTPTIPNFGTLVYGILIGIFASCLTLFMFATSDITLKIPNLQLAKAKQNEPNATAPIRAESKVVPEPRFDFYTELTKNETEAVKDLKSPTKTINGYIVQAGSFKKIGDADALKARLTLNGFAAKIEAVPQRDGEVWHRVVLGTYKTEQNAKSLQQKLKALEIDSTLVLKYAN